MCSLFSDSDGIGLASIPRCADINVVTTGREISSCTAPNCNVVVPASVSFQRLEALRRVVMTGYVVFQRQKTLGRVVGTGGVAKESLGTESGILTAACIFKKRDNARSCIGSAICVVGERLLTDGGVVTRCAVKQRLKTDSGVEATADVAGERSRTHRCIIDSIETIVGERSETDTGVVAAICVGCERAIAGRGVVVAGRVVEEGINTGSSILRPAGVGFEREITYSRVVVSVVVRERAGTYGRVEATGCVAVERTYTGGRVGAAADVGLQREKTSGGIATAAGIAGKRGSPTSRVIAAGVVVL